MSKKAAVKEILSEVSDGPIRRSSRISLNQTPVSSPLPKSIATRRSSASSISEKNKSHSVDTSPTESTVKRKTRRTSTEEDIKSTPIKPQRSSISKIIEEDKKVSSSPNTPSRKIGTRAASTSPSTSVPARRTRRSTSASQENEVVEEQVLLRRSTRRRSSVDTLEDASNEEVLTKTKPTARRRRSTSVDESEETSKNDVKPKTKRLYSEDNLLESIEEHETEVVAEKSEGRIGRTTVKTKKDLDLSVIEESEDTEVESNKIIKDIDDVLMNDVSPLKNKSVAEKVKSRSIFSPLPEPNMSEENTESDSQISRSDIEREHKLQKNQDNLGALSKVEAADKDIISENIKSDLQTDSIKNTSPLKKNSKERTEEKMHIETGKKSKSPGESNGNDSAIKSYITNGSDDSFTFNLNKSMDTTQFPKDTTDDDVFTSPGSNKENSCINVPPKKNENVIVSKNKSSELSGSDVEMNVFASKKSLRNNFDEPMEIDSELENVKDSGKIDTPKHSDKESKMINLEKSTHENVTEQNQESPELSVKKVIISDNTKKTTESDDSSVRVTSEDAEHSLCKTSENVTINRNEVKSNTETNEEDSDASSDISIRLVDTDDEDKGDKENESSVKENSPISSVNSSSKASKNASVSGDASKELQPQESSTSEAETNSAHTNTSMRESETGKGNEEATNVVTKKIYTESFIEEESTVESKSHQPVLEENRSTPDKKSKDKESPLQNLPSLLSEQKDKSSKSEPKQNGFEKHIPKEKTPRQSFNKKSQNDDDSEEDTDINLVINVDECRGKSPRIESPSRSKGQKRPAEESDSKEPTLEIKSSRSSKIDEIEEMKVSKNNESTLKNSEDEPSCSSHGYSKEKSKHRQSLNSESTEFNYNVEVEQVEEELINPGRKSCSRRSSNNSSADDEDETKNSNKTEEIQKELKYDEKNYSATEKGNKEEIKVEPELIDSLGTIGSEEHKNSEDQNRKKGQVETGENSVSKTEDDTKPSPSKVAVKKRNTASPLKTKPKKGDEKDKPNSDVESEKDKNISLKDCDRNSKVTSRKSCDKNSSGTDSSKRKSTNASKIQNENLKNAVSPLKSKIKKKKTSMNPSPTASRIGLDEKTSYKLDQYLNEKLGTSQNEEQDSESDKNNTENESDKNNSENEDESMSDDYETKSGFLDDMAEEGEEDTPSEGTNDIIDEGESINSKDSDIEPDDSYDLDDSFLAKDEELDLLSGEEYDLDDSPKLLEKAPKRRRRIVKSVNTSSEEESVVPSRISFSDKVEVIPKRKSPIKLISPMEDTDSRDEIISKNNVQDAQPNATPRKAPNMETPSIFIDLVDDSSESKGETESSSKGGRDFNETIRSLMDDDNSSTPNATSNQTPNTSRQNTSLRSSSIIVHENVSVTEIKEGFLAEKLQQVVSVFCAGIRSSDGNISMNVSLDYIENTPSASDNKKVNDVTNTQKSPEKTAETKSKRSFSKSEDNDDSISLTDNSRKRKFSNVFPEQPEKESFSNENNPEEIITAEDFSLLNASFDDENSIQNENKMDNSGRAQKKRRSSTRKAKRLSNKNSVSSTSSENYNMEDPKEVEENKSEDSPTKTEEMQVRNAKQKRRSSSKIEKPSNENSEKSFDKEDSSKKKLVDNSESEGSTSTSKYTLQSNDEEIESKRSNDNSEKSFDKKDSSKKKLVDNSESEGSTSTSKYTLQSTDEEKESKNSGYELSWNVEKVVSDDASEPGKKKKKKSNKRKLTEKASSEMMPELSKRVKLLEMECEEMSPGNLRNKLSSHNNTSGESNALVKTKKLKRLQSNLRRDIKNTFSSGLVTDVKNRPRRIMKPSIEMGSKDWLIEDIASKPSSANLSKFAFNFKKIDPKDFKNQTLYDPRVKREPTSSYLKKKGRY